MITKTKLAIGAISTIFSSWGAYELLRTSDGGYSLDKKEDNPKEVNDGEEKQVKDEKIEPGKKEEKATPEVPVLQYQTYRDYILSNSPNIKLVNEEASLDDVNNTLLHKMIPSYSKSYMFNQDQMFKGNYPLLVTGEYIWKNRKNIYILKKRELDVKYLKSNCIRALNKNIQPSDTNDVIHKQAEQLKTWCSILNIREALLRNKFKFPEKDEEWNLILESEWIKNDQYHDKQSLFTKEEMQKLKKPDKEGEGIQLLKNKCDKTLSEPFTRSNFPANVSFLGEGQKADTFQEVALFCTVPITAETYVKENVQGNFNTEISNDFKYDYCNEKEKDLNYYKTIKTTDPMGGKSFWCAVRMIHEAKDYS